MHVAHAQDSYIVQNIKGQVKKSNNLLKKGDKITSNDKINFAKGAVMMVSSQIFGQMVLSANGKTIQSEMAYTFSDLFPQSRKASTRANLVLNNALDFQNNFGNELFRVYGEEYAVKVASSYNLINTTKEADKFFFFKMNLQGKESFNKHIKGVKNELFFKKPAIFEMEGKRIEAKETKFEGLYFYDKNATEFPKIADFQLEFVDDKELLELSKPLIEMINKKNFNLVSYDILYNQIKDLADNIYGKTAQKDGLEYWIETKLGINKPQK